MKTMPNSTKEEKYRWIKPVLDGEITIEDVAKVYLQRRAIEKKKNITSIGRWKRKEYRKEFEAIVDLVWAIG